MKRCSHCRLEKAESEFNRNKAQKDGLQNVCKACHRIYKNDWEQRHSAERKHYFAQWHVANIERNHARNNAACRLKYHSDPSFRAKKNAQKRELVKRKYATNPAWVEQFRKAGRNRRQKRRVRIMLAAGTHSEQEWQNLCEHHDHKCVACGDNKQLTRDHVIPLSKGGSDFIENIQPLCGNCNSQKHTKVIDYRKR